METKGLDHRLYNNKINSPEGEGQNLLRYPLIQYRTLDGYATIWGLNEGAAQLETDLKKIQAELGRHDKYPVQIVRYFSRDPEKIEYLGDEKFVRYRLSNYLPLSNHTDGTRKLSTYQEYEQTERFADKIAIFERILTAHLILFGYAAGWELTKHQRLITKLVDIKSLASGVYKKNHPEKEKHFRKFDFIVDINAQLPDGIAVGNQTSLGYGVIETVT